ncbi:MAG: hypothetical protein ACK5EA_19545 [Planctomycetaceae bacterium]
MTERTRKPPRRRDGPGGLTAEIVEHLLEGNCLFAEFILDTTEAVALWLEHGPDLLSGFILRNPGCRPWAWWLLAVREHGPRRQLRDGPRALNGALWFGVPSMWTAPPPPDMHETQLDYLQRQGLLEHDEQRLLTATDTAPDGRWSKSHDKQDAEAPRPPRWWHRGT